MSWWARGGAPTATDRRPVRVRALAVWRRELDADTRTVTTFDPLWRAACLEAWAVETGLKTATAARYVDEAERIIATAAQEQVS